MIINTTCTITHTTSADSDAWYSVPFEYVTVLNVPQITVELDDSIITYGTDYTVGVQGLKLLNNTEAGKTLIIARTTPLTQETDFQTGMIDPDEIEHSFDLAAMRDQDIQAQVDKLADVPVDHEQRIDAIEHKIPDAASETNKLTDKNYVDTADGGLQTQITDNKGTMDGHIARTDNPHSVTKAQVGLGNCDNTADIDKPVSTAVQSAITAHTSRTDNPHSVTKAQVGLGNCDNTADIDKPISTAVQSALDGKITKNAPIIAGTKGMIAYNSEGVVLGGREIYTLDLADVDTINPLDGQVLMYDDATHLWKPKTSTASISFDGVTGSPYDNTALAHELNIKTNCITNIPQDIKLEFNTSTKVLTLKAGSKLYVPNGASTFDVVNITTDQTLTNTFGGQYDEIFVCWDSANNTFRQTPTVSSGDTDSSTAANRIWYDTVNNKIKYYANSGTTVTSDSISLPFCIMQNAGGGNGFTKIQQVFNGFGYIGRSTFVLPGVKALRPDGYNADGTSKNVELNFTGVTVRTHTVSEGSLLCFLASNGINAYGVINYFESDTMPTDFGTYATWYDTKNNFVWGTDDGGTTWTKYTRIYLGKMVKLTTGTGNITLFAPHDVFRAVDYEHVKDMMTTDTEQAVTAIKSLQAANDDEWQIKKLNADNTASSQSVQTAAAFRVRDKNDLIMGDLRVIRGTNGTVTTSMYARNRATGSDVNAVISCAVDNAGTVSTSAPALDTANSILTTIAKSKAQSGYFKLGNGLIIQWGFTGTSANPHDKTFTFPTPFSSDTSFSVVSVSTGASGTGWTDGITAQTSTGFTIYGTTSGTSVNNNVRWIAIGY